MSWASILKSDVSGQNCRFKDIAVKLQHNAFRPLEYILLTAWADNERETKALTQVILDYMYMYLLCLYHEHLL